ncbi:MAG: alanine--tRNA ligase, partial [Gammaproteobacteria bacterium]|nr:alanine--tRNA ligase [Gammaproteobacteria bacterium]
MGLERMAAVMQHVHSNYEIDLFDNLIKYIANIMNVSDLANQSLRVIADHIRSTSFMILDGVLPGNEGRGYVLRRIIRRALRHGNKLGVNTSFFYKLVEGLVKEMGDAYPDLKSRQQYIEDALLKEEEQFARTLEQGMKILEQDISDLKGNVISGETVFKLYDTYGFPVDLTADIARERDLTIDEDGFEVCMNEQRDRARAANQFGADYNDTIKVEGQTAFVGYEETSSQSQVVDMFVSGGQVDAITTGTEADLVLDTTPFYAESGGQVGDKGLLKSDSFEFEVKDTVKLQNVFLHRGIVTKGTIKKNDKAEAIINQEERDDTALNHSATHLMHAALRKILGEHVEQKGSLVDSQRLRFDFSHPVAVTEEEIFKIEKMVNQQIRNNHAVGTHVTDMDEAKKLGAMMLFGEKYGEKVRVLSMGDFSVELCGGTHVKQTGDIGAFKIIGEQGIASGIRRIEAITGDSAIEYTQKQGWLINQLASSLKTDRMSLGDKVEQLILKSKEQDREIEKLKSKISASKGGELVNQKVVVDGINVLAAKIEGVSGKELRTLSDQLKNQMGSGILALAAEESGKVSLVTAVTKDLTDKYHAGNLMKHLAEQLGGRGGGRPDMAQGGGTNAENLPAALDGVVDW